MSTTPPPPAPHSITMAGSVTGRIVGRRRCSKRLAFYDLHELADVRGVDALASALAAASGGATTHALGGEGKGCRVVTPGCQICSMDMENNARHQLASSPLRSTRAVTPTPPGVHSLQPTMCFDCQSVVVEKWCQPYTAAGPRPLPQRTWS
jgi:hypothetical protein